MEVVVPLLHFSPHGVAALNIFTMVSRRPTRASRSSRAARPSRSSTSSIKDESVGPFGLSGSNSGVIRKTDLPASKWLCVQRPPAPGVGFKVETWVREDQLTHDERVKYLPESIATSEDVKLVAVADGNAAMQQQQEGSNSDGLSALHIAAAIACAQPDEQEIAAAVAASSQPEMTHNTSNAAAGTSHAAAPAEMTGPPPTEKHISNPLNSTTLEPPAKRARIDEAMSYDEVVAGSMDVEPTTAPPQSAQVASDDYIHMTGSTDSRKDEPTSTSQSVLPSTSVELP
ncbi:hypothetical protein MPSEU_000634900 [Mayamaea pseudoterrestris]|nr:hypothetical protein MPSEU_000634900 [Mayamaea pseudoterrestris]